MTQISSTVKDTQNEVIMTTENSISEKPTKTSEKISFFSHANDYTTTDVEIQPADIADTILVSADGVEYVESPDLDIYKEHIRAHVSFLLNRCEIPVLPSKNGVPQMATDEGRAFCDPSYGFSQLSRWDDPKMEYSIICGEPSQIVVIDVDDRAYMESMILPAITAHRLPMPYTIVRGSAPGRCHMYYRLPVGQTIKSGPVPGSNGKIEIKANGTYIRGPWSVLKDHKVRSRVEHVDGVTLPTVRHYEPFLTVKNNMNTYSYLPYSKDLGDVEWPKLKRVNPAYAGGSGDNTASMLDLKEAMYTDSLTEYHDEWWVPTKPGRKTHIKCAPGSVYLSWSANSAEIINKMAAHLNTIDASDGNKNIPTYRAACTILIDFATPEEQALDILTEWADRKGCLKHVKSCFSSAKKQLASRIDRGLQVGKLLVSSAKLDDTTQKIKSSLTEYKLTNRGEAIYAPSVTNLKDILESDPRIRLTSDQFTGLQFIEIDGVTDGPKLLQEDAKFDLVSFLSKTYGISFAKNDVRDICNATGRWFEKVDSLKDQVRALPAGDDALLDTWLIRATGCSDTPLHRAYGRKFAISMIARAYATEEHPAEVHTVLLLKGDQGAGKSSLFKALAGRSARKSLHSDAKIDFGSSEALYKIRGVWLYELAELSSLKKSEIEEVKAYLSQKEDNERLKYERQASTPVRRVVFGGTTNADTPLKDETGNRRWWVVQVGKMDVPWVSENRDAILGAARQAYLAGMENHTPHLWWLAPAEESLHKTAVATEVESEEVLTEQISDYLESNNLHLGQTFSMAEVASAIDLTIRGKGDEMRLSKALKYLGYSTKKIRMGGKIVSHWIKNDMEVAPRVQEGVAGLDFLD